MSHSTTYLVFGDLHGRVLPAFALARAWQREYEEPVAALLQVGDLGYFPFPDRMDRATRKFASRDADELGVQLVVCKTDQADAVFLQHPDAISGGMWFVAGNHEDHEALTDCQGAPGSSRSTVNDFPVDHYDRVRCIINGQVTTLPGGLTVGGLWGIDDEAPGARKRLPPGARLDVRLARRLAMQPNLDVLLTHESPRDAIYFDSGSEAISLIIDQAKPAFAFFGHYHSKGRLDECDFGTTQVYHLAGLEFQGKKRSAEPGCVGVLRWDANSRQGEFDYLDPSWLRSVTRDNWAER